VWGVLLDSVHLYNQLDELRWPVLVRQVDTALARWREPDQGLGEVAARPSTSPYADEIDRIVHLIRIDERLTDEAALAAGPGARRA
jgi:hypothetical protein